MVQHQSFPADPRQRGTYRLLQLVGGEPAAYFRDACRLMDREPRLEATTHVVAHLLREVDGSLAGVLRPTVDPARWPEPASQDAQRRRIDAICDALRIAADDDFRAAWRDYAGRLHRHAHRHGLAAPRPVDAEFRALWEDGQTVILRLSRQIEANFTATLPLIDRLAASDPDLRTLRSQVPHSTVALDRFFEQAGLAWLEPLWEAGYFDRPPPLAYNDDGSVGYQRWPQGRYLARVAADAPDAVIEICLAIETDNPEAHESLVDAALALEPENAARMVPAITRSLATPVQWGLPFKARDLIVHLVPGDAVDEGLAVLSALLENARARNDRRTAGHLVGELTPEIFPRAGLAGLELLSDRLAEEAAAESRGSHDYSYVWRPTLEAGRRQDLRDQLVSAVRDAAGAIVDADQTHLGAVMALVEAHDGSIFGRIGLDLLRRYPDTALVTARLTDRALFESIDLEREYTTLSREEFANLDPKAREAVLGWIEEGPRRGTKPDEEARKRWQLHMLDRLGPLARPRDRARQAPRWPRHGGPGRARRQVGGRQLRVAKAHAALLEQQPAEPPDCRALVAVGLLVEQQQTDHQGVVERRRARQVGDRRPHAGEAAALQRPAVIWSRRLSSPGDERFVC